MPTKDLVILLSVFVGIVLFVVIFFFPSEEKKRKKRKRKQEQKISLSDEEKKWQEAALKLKERIGQLNQEIDKVKIEHRRSLERIKEEKQKNIKIQEKLKREKKWFHEQESSMGQRTNEMRQIKIELTKAQTEREKEYSLRLSSNREKKDIKHNLEVLNKEKQNLLLKVSKIEFNLKTQKDEILDLKRINASLLKKKESEDQWIAKSEFLKLEKTLKQKEQEIKKLQEDWRR